jgi:hypothetical protein
VTATGAVAAAAATASGAKLAPTSRRLEGGRKAALVVSASLLVNACEESRRQVGTDTQAFGR